MCHLQSESERTFMLAFLKSCITLKLTTNQNCFHEEIKSKLNSVIACYHSVQSLVSSRLLTNNVKIIVLFIYYLFLFRSARSIGLRQCLAIRGSCFSFLDPLDIW
jgi:hypothetical protein